VGSREAYNRVSAGQEPRNWCRGRDLNPPHACLAIFQSRALCSKVDPSCCQLKADVDAGPHLLSSGPSANARRWIPPGCILPGLNGPAWILWEDGVEELVQAYAIAWTKRAVRVRFGAPPHQHEVWVWAGAVERA